MGQFVQLVEPGNDPKVPEEHTVQTPKESTKLPVGQTSQADDPSAAVDPDAQSIQDNELLPPVLGLNVFNGHFKQIVEA